MRCEVWTYDIQSSIEASGFQCLKLLGMKSEWVFGRRLLSCENALAPAISPAQCLRLEFSNIDGDNRACRGSSVSDNNPRNYIIAEGQV